MRPKPTQRDAAELFRSQLDNIIDMKHAIVILSKQIDWVSIEKEFGERFRSHRGRPAIPVRLMVGLMIMQHTEGLSDDETVIRWLCNPYWQYFSGMSHFQHKVPIHPSSMSRWRKYIGENGAEKILSLLVRVAVEQKVVDEKDLSHVNVDTTVQEKAITYPTDSKLLCRSLLNLVKCAKENNLSLRQTYTRTARKLSLQAARYAHARQYKRMRGCLKSLHTRLGRIIREVERQHWECPKLKEQLDLARRLHAQQKTDSDKLYSLHRPEAECISKGKVHKRYEFGCKVGAVTTNKKGFVVGIKAYHGNPYDGHTFAKSIKQAESITGKKIDRAFVDKGYRGCSYEGVEVFRSGQRGLSRWFKKQLKRRSHIEATIGHMKNEGKLDKNWLKGQDGDKIHALLCGIGQNVRLLLNAISFLPNFLWNLREKFLFLLKLLTMFLIQTEYQRT